MKFGLGFGLNRNHFLGSEIVKELKDAGAVLALLGNRYGGVDNEWHDVINGYICTLFNQAGTIGSGFNSENGQTYNTLDGVDDYGGFPDIPELDITTAPLAIGVTFKKTMSDAMYAICRNLDSFGSIQYSVYFFNSPNVVSFTTMGNRYAEINMDAYDGEYLNIVFYWDGVNVTGYLNGSQQTQQVFAGSLISQPNTQLGARSASIDGVSKSFFLDADIATQTIYTGSDIDKILAIEAKISAPYLALNP